MKFFGFAQQMFDFQSAQERFGDAILEAGAEGFDWTDMDADAYDDSLELYEVAPSARLNEAQQRLIFDAGFHRIWLNHADAWETYYAWPHDGFVPVEGSRSFKPGRAALRKSVLST